MQRFKAAHVVVLVLSTVGLIALIGGCGSSSSGTNTTGGLPGGTATRAQVEQGRYQVMSGGCGDCHNRGKTDPSDTMWLGGYIGNTPGGPGATVLGQGAGAPITYAANITPDNTTGIGMHTDRQIFNALRYGLDPEDTPDVVITSTTPGSGNFPAQPHYLAPPMPWPSFRHKTDADLWAIVAYLKHGIKPVSNQVAANVNTPPDFWASAYTANVIGPYPLPAYPAGNELPPS